MAEQKQYDSCVVVTMILYDPNFLCLVSCEANIHKSPWN